MIDLPSERRAAARAYLDRQLGSADELVHRCLTGSFKIGLIRAHIEDLLRVLDYLLTGEAAETVEAESRFAVHSFGADLGPPEQDDAVIRAGRLFVLDSTIGTYVGDALTARPTPAGRGSWPDMTTVAMQWLGVRQLLIEVTDALIDEPYRPAPTSEEPRAMTWREAVVRDVSFALTPDVLRVVVDAGWEHWPDWDQALALARSMGTASPSGATHRG